MYDRWGSPPHVTSPNSGPPLPCKQALRLLIVVIVHRRIRSTKFFAVRFDKSLYLRDFCFPIFTTNENNGLCHTKWLKVKYYEEKKKGRPKTYAGTSKNERPRTGKIWSLLQGFVISRFFCINFAITGVEKLFIIPMTSLYEVCTVFYLVRIATRFVYVNIYPFPPYCNRKIGLLKIKMAGSFIIRGPAHPSSRCCFFT